MRVFNRRVEVFTQKLNQLIVGAMLDANRIGNFMNYNRAAHVGNSGITLPFSQESVYMANSLRTGHIKHGVDFHLILRSYMPKVSVTIEYSVQRFYQFPAEAFVSCA